MIHDATASVVNLARMMLGGLDESRVETRVATTTLRLLLETLIDVGAPAHHQKAAADAQRSVASMMMPALLDERENHRGRL